MVSYVGYGEVRKSVSLAGGETHRFDIKLVASHIDLNPIVVTASRRHEKVLKAPAAISVLDRKEIEGDVSPSSASLVRDAAGVDVAQTGIDRYEIVLRGFNNVFTRAAYVLVDYRQSALASLGLNYYSLMPINNLDLERVEIVRGPGAALYGPGVDSGVIHFLTKDPFAHPGTTISIGGGERSVFSGAFRSAGVVDEKLGYKVVGHYVRGNEWEFDRNNAEDKAQLQTWVRPPEYDNWKYNINGMLEYRFDRRTQLTASGGLVSNKGMGQTITGTSQSAGWRSMYGQLRLRAGNFFAQTYLNHSDAGDTYNYSTGVLIVDNSTQFKTEAQYDFDLAGGRGQVIIGTDLDLTIPDTDGTINGRNEDKDRISEIGGYVQATTALSPQVDVTVALRGDYNNLFEQVEFSPRAALVLNPTETHSFRATYNRAHTLPDNFLLFLDIPVAVQPIAGPYNLILQGRGSIDGFSFGNFRTTRTADVILPIPGLFGQAVPANSIPLTPLYGTVATVFGDVLRFDNPPPPFNSLDAQQRNELAQFLNSLIPLVQGSTAGVLDPAPVDVKPIKQTVTQTFEVGYKGLIGDRVLFAADAYYSTKKNFGGPLELVSPLVFIPQVESDLAAALTPVLAGAVQADPNVNGLLAGLSPEQTAAILAGSGGAVLGGNPVAVVQPDQEVLSAGSATEVGGFLAFRSFGKIDFWGLDLAAQVLASDRLSLFGSVSVVRDDLFDEKELGEVGTGLALALNAPKVKVKGGFEYRDSRGFSFQASGQYVDGFPMLSGVFTGDVDDYFVLTVGAGYDLGRYIHKSDTLKLIKGCG